MCKSAKEIWDKLQLIYEGTPEVRETKASLLASKYEMFKMNPDESIFDMFARFMQLVNSLKVLGKEFSNFDLVRKVLRSLTSSWHTNVSVIEDFKNLFTMSLDELIGSLMTNELNLEKDAVDDRVKRSIALKAKAKPKYVDEDTSNSEKSNEEALQVFKKFLKKNKKFKSEHKHLFKNSSKSKNKSTKEADHLVCFCCRKSGHMKEECSKNKKKLKKNKMKDQLMALMTAAWTIEDTDANIGEYAHHITRSSQKAKSQSSFKSNDKLCFMANGESSYGSNSAQDGFFVEKQEEEAYELILEKNKKIKRENKELKKKIHEMVHDRSPIEDFEVVKCLMDEANIEKHNLTVTLKFIEKKLHELEDEKQNLLQKYQDQEIEKQKLQDELVKAKEKLTKFSKAMKGKEIMKTMADAKVQVELNEHGCAEKPNVKKLKVLKSASQVKSITQNVRPKPSKTKRFHVYMYNSHKVKNVHNGQLMDWWMQTWIFDILLSQFHIKIIA